MKNSMAISRATYGRAFRQKGGEESKGGEYMMTSLPDTDQMIAVRLTWKDLMKVQSKVRIPSPLLRSLTSRMTRNSRKKVMEMRALSSVFCGEAVGSQRGQEDDRECREHRASGCALWHDEV